MTDADFHDGWVKITSIPGGWRTYCRLCGKSFAKSFHGASTNYALAEAASREYATEHLASAAHRAALAAFYAKEKPPRPNDEHILVAVFGMAPKTERELRRDAARRAAVRAQ